MKQYNHIILKALCFAIFGAGGILILLFIIYPGSILIRGASAKERIFRVTISRSFAIFIRIMEAFKLLELQWEGLSQLQEKPAMIICANHPSLIDVVFLIAQIQNASCIVKSSQWKNPFIKGVISRVYIPNSLNAEETLSACQDTLDKGNHIILFPEGTRTPKNPEQIKLYRSAAQLALRTGKSILPIHIKMETPTGLGKEESFFSVPQTGKIKSQISVKNIIPMTQYNSLQLPIAARRLTADLKFAIFP